MIICRRSPADRVPELGNKALQIRNLQRRVTKTACGRHQRATRTAYIDPRQITKGSLWRDTMWSPKTKLLVALATLGGLGAIGATALSQDRGGPGPDQRPGIHLAHGGGWFRHRGAGQHFGFLCDADARQEWLDARLGLVESFAEFNPEQAAAWTAFTDAVRTASGRMDELCEQAHPTERPDSAPERLARAETFLAAGLAVVQEVRPSFERLYATLNDEQKAALDRMTTGRHRG